MQVNPLFTSKSQQTLCETPSPCFAVHGTGDFKHRSNGLLIGQPEKLRAFLALIEQLFSRICRGDGVMTGKVRQSEDRHVRSLCRPSGSGGKIHKRQSAGACDRGISLFLPAAMGSLPTNP
jgi:hypothetical protein